MQLQLRDLSTNFETREENSEPIIEGYFAVFNSIYQIADGLSESIAPNAFDNTLGNDIRALTNHDTTLVLGRNKNNTLELKTDSHGLWGRVRINPKDTQAMDTYERVKRGDVDQCSIGFEIVRETTESKPDGSVHWTIDEINLFEVSVCTIPAYTETSINARSEQAEEIHKREKEAWKLRMLNKLKGNSENGIESIDDKEEAGSEEE